MRSALCFLVLCPLVTLACGPVTPQPPVVDRVVAEIDGRPIAQSELDAWVKEELWQQQLESQVSSQLYALRISGLERLIDEKLLEAAAEREGLSPDALLTQETAEVAEVDEAAIQSFWEENQARLGDTTLEESRPRIRDYLTESRQTDAIAAYRRGLRAAASVAIKLEAPRVAVPPTGPSLGPADALITIVEFSDYECPYCRRSEATIKQVLDRYGDRVRFVYRHFPLDFHLRARPAAEAAACADEQGRFWEYHEQLFAVPELENDDLARLAGESGLDVASFKTCVTERRSKPIVDTDIAEGDEAGVTGTPAFFINGIFLGGAQPLDAFVKTIDRELAHLAALDAGS